MNDLKSLQNLCKQIRYHILTSTTQAGSGHPTSSLSAVELMTALFFGGFLRYDINDPYSHLNDRVIFSKGHAAPLLYALWTAAGAISKEEMLTLRQFGSRLEGHPTPALPFVDVATGSLGQGLSVGVGMALALKNIGDESNSKSQISNGQNNLTPNIYVLLGDSEFAEGQNWEAMQIASHYKLNNLIGILDVNRLGQRGETMLGWDIETYQKRIESFGWRTIIIKDGHNISEIISAFNQQLSTNNQQPFDSAQGKPLMFIAKTIKGKGISFLENQEGWHGKPIPKEHLQEAITELGKIDWNIKGKIEKSQDFVIGGSRGRGPDSAQNTSTGGRETTDRIYHEHSLIATREAYGDTLVSLGGIDKRIVVLDAETSNSTYAEKFKKDFPDRFFEMFIAEQNMVSTALGFSKMGLIPFISSFAAFLTRAFDQIRMSQYSFAADNGNSLIIAGSHAGCSIGVDGSSQMALEDISMMRSIRESTVLYPSDAVSTAKLTSLLVHNPGISYLRLTREKTPVIYNEREEFRIGGLKIIEITNNKLQITSQFEITNNKYSAVIIAAGITLHEALKAQKILAEKGLSVIVVDLYSIKPLDEKTILQLAKQTNHIIVVEDHYPTGGIGEAVLTALNRSKKKELSIKNNKNNKAHSNFLLLTSPFLFTHLCVSKLPHSGRPEELLQYEGIDAEAVVIKVMD